VKSEVRIGISGWNYAGWRGVFYPKGWPHRRELEFASRAFNSTEINGSFYSLQRPTSYRHWYEETPENLFSVKGARFITHIKNCARLKCRWRISLLPAFSRLRKNWARFSGNFHRTWVGTKKAALLGRRHDSKLKTRAWLKVKCNRALRYCVETRHVSFLVPDFFELLREFNIAFVLPTPPENGLPRKI
jgi:uncharacterized protein YecE (DUF72 family)